jgi:Cu/Ag efflux protein CusF
VHRYTVRGEVTHVSTGGNARRVTLRHEAVDHFRNESGEVVGMPAMVMPFELAPAVELQGIRAGDKVEVRFAVAWSPPSVKVEELRKLPDDVQLQFGGGPTLTPEKK